jgi:hypothetical protein
MDIEEERPVDVPTCHLTKMSLIPAEEENFHSKLCNLNLINFFTKHDQALRLYRIVLLLWLLRQL